MNPTSIIKEIENNYDVSGTISSQVPIWQYVRNLIYGQAIDDKIKKNRIKDFYHLIQNRNWGNCQNSKNIRYLTNNSIKCNKLTNKRKEPLAIGPNRVDHNCEMIWNNQSKRHTVCNKK